MQTLIAALGEVMPPKRLSTAIAQCQLHGHGESYHPSAPPDVVAWPQNLEEVVAVVNVCRRFRAPIVPFGAGTSLEGHVTATNGGVCLDMSLMNTILRVSVDDLDTHVEAGVTRLQLERYLLPKGIFFPVDPGADATIGGMIATNASGTTTVRYGAMRQNVLAMTIVTADGNVVRTRSRARKSSAGYDLTQLFIGSEGSLGIITDAILRVFPTAEAISAAVCSFASLESAVSCATLVLQSGIPIARLELLDDKAIDAVNRRHELTLSALPTLLFEFHGSPNEVEAHAEAVRELAAECDGTDFRWARDQRERAQLWEARHHAYEATLALRPGSSGFITDACVPISHLAQCIRETQADLASTELVGTILGHVGDGNFHVILLIDPDDISELNRASGFSARLAERAIRMEGTCTGEHGVGYGKARFLPLEHGESGVDLMRAIKRALDPENLFNPGKILTDV